MSRLLRTQNFLLSICATSFILSPVAIYGSEKINKVFAVGGFAHGSVPGMGFGYRYAYSDTWKFMGEFVAASLDLRDSLQTNTVEATRAELSSQDILLKSQFFIGKTFFIEGGLGQRSVTIDLGARDRIADIYAEAKMESKSIVAQFSIGNEWTFAENLSLGCEWIGTMVPLSSSSRATLNSNFEVGPSFAQARADLTSLSEKIGRSTTYQTVQVNLG